MGISGARHIMTQPGSKVPPPKTPLTAIALAGMVTLAVMMHQHHRPSWEACHRSLSIAQSLTHSFTFLLRAFGSKEEFCPFPIAGSAYIGR